MDYINLGKAGLKVSRICLGCLGYGSPATSTEKWGLDETASRPFLKHALDLGINFFDTANIYSTGASEEILGRAILDYARREEVVIATKVYGTMRDDPNGRGLSRKAIMNEIDASLMRLGTDHVDIYQIHRFDPNTPLEETLEALHDVVKAGKARYLGASSMAAWKFMKALSIQKARGWAPFISMQNYYNLLYREEEREMLPLCEAEGIGVLPWSPLARGTLARPWSDTPTTMREETDIRRKRMFADTQDIDQPVVARLEQIAASRGIPQAHLAIAWLLHKPVVVAPIFGATRMKHLDDAVAAVTLKLDPAEIEALEQDYRVHPITASS